MAEVDLCGHATLASADVLFRFLHHQGRTIRFETRSGILEVECRDGVYAMDFPATVPLECDVSPVLSEALGVAPRHALKAFDHIAVLETEEQVRTLSPDIAHLANLDLRGVVVTAPGRRADFVSRFFAPKLGVNEDPVTGSAHCELARQRAMNIEFGPAIRPDAGASIATSTSLPGRALPAAADPNRMARRSGGPASSAA